MDAKTETVDIPRTALKAAADWKVRLDHADVDVELKSRFTAWLELDEMHKRAWGQISETGEKLTAISDAPDIVALRQETITRVIAAKEVRRQTQKTFVAACMLVLAIGGVVFWGSNYNPLITSLDDAQFASVNAIPATSSSKSFYETGVGERVEIVLDDASVIMMDTQSRLSVDFGANERSVHLYEGRAMFDVAKDVNRPFSVEVNGRIVTALGTKFDVRSIAGEFEVNLVEGRVTVESPPSINKPVPTIVELKPGFQAVAISLEDAPVVSPVNVIQNTSWERGLLIFDNDTLQDAVAEMNRYSSVKLVLADEETSQLRLSGAFKAGDNRGFADALRLYFSIEKLTDNDHEIVISLAP